MKRPYGFTPAMFDSYIRAAFLAKVNPETNGDGGKRVVQTIGNAEKSAGFHKQDGVVVVNGQKIPYCAAVDLSVRGLSAGQIRIFLAKLAEQGWAGWYRYEGSFSDSHHMHIVYCGVKMKPELLAQAGDFLNDRTGLVGHALEKFYTAPASVDAVLAHMLLRANPTAKKYVPAQYR